MNNERTMSLDADAVLAQSWQHLRIHSEAYTRSVAYSLLNMILQQRAFKSFESLIAFCEQPDNLKCCLPSESDRCIFSAQLSTTLRNMPAPALANRDAVCA